MTVLVQYKARGETYFSTVVVDKPDDWFYAFRAQHNYDEIVSHMAIGG